MEFPWNAWYHCTPFQTCSSLLTQVTLPHPKLSLMNTDAVSYVQSDKIIFGMLHCHKCVKSGLHSALLPASMGYSVIRNHFLSKKYLFLLLTNLCWHFFQTSRFDAVCIINLNIKFLYEWYLSALVIKGIFSSKWF